MLFDEAIEKPRPLGRFRKHSFTASIDSPHEGEIILGKLLEVLYQKAEKLLGFSRRDNMKVLIIHNDYQQPGGETVTVRAQIALLREQGHQVVTYLRDN